MSTENRRHRELARIHLLAKRELGMDDMCYRAMLDAVAGVNSAAELDDAGRRLVLDHLSKHAAKSGRYPGRPHNIDSVNAPAELRKIEALLAEARRPWSYADAIAERMHGVALVAWCRPEQLRGVIAALTANAKREGRRTE